MRIVRLQVREKMLWANILWPFLMYHKRRTGNQTFSKSLNLSTQSSILTWVCTLMEETSPHLISSLCSTTNLTMLQLLWVIIIICSPPQILIMILKPNLSHHLSQSNQVLNQLVEEPTKNKVASSYTARWTIWSMSLTRNNSTVSSLQRAEPTETSSVMISQCLWIKCRLRLLDKPFKVWLLWEVSVLQSNLNHSAHLRHR